MMRSRIRFAHKITLLIASFILLTSLSITSVTVYRFRRELYQQEYSGAFTVYMAVVNYLTGHYKSNKDTFVRRSLNYVLDQKFLRTEGVASEMITHRPSYLVIYDQEGNRVYEYGAAPGGEDAPLVVPVETLPASYRHGYDRRYKAIKVAGPISQSGDVPGFVDIYFPSAIEEKTAAMILQSFVIMIIVLLVATGLSWLFARRVLAPIEALTRAAQRVHDGDLDQRVSAATSDEIGLLTETFNEMVSSLVRRIALMHRMQEWTMRISKEFDVNLLYDNLMDMFERMSGASWCGLYVHNTRSNAFEMVRCCGAAQQPPAGDALTKRANESGAPAFLRPDGQMVHQTSEALEMAFPLSAGMKRIGVIRIGPSQSQKSYTDDTLTTLQTLTQHASVAIDNANLYQELAEKERFKQEMMWAREIQKSLLPRTVPHMPGYDVSGVSIPAFEVGGDYFDYIPAPGEHWHFVIGDVSGKGVPAAMIMSVVRSLIHTYIEFEQRPCSILSRVNRNLSPDLEAEMFVTMATMRVDPEKHVARLVRAGHEPFIIVRGTGEVVRMEPRGTALGLLDAAAFDNGIEEVEFRFEPHDTVLLYTDGITETRNRKGEEFGYSRLEQLAQENARLSVAELVKTIVSNVSAFSEGQEQHDDITLVVLRRDGA